ncbi:glyoxalase [Aliidongia dinghuensis]|uniref:Glyoxalase n=1 Tax=Aliidongia dinghuensis TaxID=1867774 RepID=A0A8J2YQX6_9PROT|nr:VOC family protein [Aliidongia dinghuensis]GGF07352.1 glyoxalase [Aliidongia dinghuensis]
MPPTLFSHLSLGVTDLARSIAFYDAVMAALGGVRCFTGPVSVGYGPTMDKEDLALKLRPGSDVTPRPGFHLAFAADSREMVDRFYAAALSHGGKDDGPPGLRPYYGPTYYAAFVIDPDGHRLEAVHQ